jgi:hypothetical protein
LIPPRIIVNAHLPVGEFSQSRAMFWEIASTTL